MGFTSEESRWLTSYRDRVVEAFSARFSYAASRFDAGDRLLNRFKSAIDSVVANGRHAFRGAEEAHNELCIANELLSNSSPVFDQLEYEPALSGTARSIDFRATAGVGPPVHVDVKTIKPASRDRWDQFQQAVRENWLPQHVVVGISKEWLGGEIWHGMFSARSRMLEYAIELEEKIKDSELVRPAITILALCGEGFHWHEDQLEDFIAYYRSGTPRPDDPFGKMQVEYVRQKQISLGRTISRFACMTRDSGEIFPRRLNWNVQPPHDQGLIVS